MLGRIKEHIWDKAREEVVEEQVKANVDKCLEEAWEKDLEQECRRVDCNRFKRTDCFEGRFSPYQADQNKKRLTGLYNKQVLEECV